MAEATIDAPTSATPASPAATTTPAAPQPNPPSSFAEAARKFLNSDSPALPDPDSGEDAPAPKKEAAKPQSKEADDAPPEVKTEESRKGWKEWKAKHEAVLKERDEFKQKYTETETSLKQQIDQVNRELAEAKKGFVDPKEIETLKAEREDLRLRLKLKDVQEDPSWKGEIEQPLSAAIEDARQNAPKESRALLARLMMEPASEARNDAIEDIVRDLSPLKQFNIAQAIKTADTVNAKKSALLADQKRLAASYEEFQRTSAERESAESRAKLESAVEAVLKQATDPENGLGVFKPVDATPEAKSAAQEAAHKARRWASSDLKPDDRARLAAWAVQGEQSVKLLSAAHSEIVKLQKQIDSLTTATPSGGASTGESKSSKPLSFIEAVKAQMAG